MYKIKNFLSSGQIPEDFKDQVNNFREILLNYDVVNKLSYTIRYYVVINGKSFCMLHCVHHKDIQFRNKLSDTIILNSQFEAFKEERYSISQDYFEDFLSLVEDKYKDFVITKSCVKAYQLAFFKALQYCSRTFVNFFKSLSFSKLFREHFSFVHGRFAIRNFEAFPFEKKLFIRFNHLRDIYPSVYRDYLSQTFFYLEFSKLERSLYKSYSNSTFKAIQNIGVSKASLTRLFKMYMFHSIFKNTDLSYLYDENGNENFDFHNSKFNRTTGTFSMGIVLNFILDNGGNRDEDIKNFNKIKGYDSDLSYLISLLLNGSSKYQPLENNFSNEEKEAFYQKCIDLYFYHLFHCFKEEVVPFSFKVFFIYMVKILNLNNLSFVLNLDSDIKISLIMPNKGIKNNNCLICSPEYKSSALFINQHRYFSNHLQTFFLKILDICSINKRLYHYSANAILEIIIFAEELSYVDLYKFYKRIIQKDNELNNELDRFIFDETNVSLFPDLFHEATGKILLFKDGTQFVQGTHIELYHDIDDDEIPF